MKKAEKILANMMIGVSICAMCGLTGIIGLRLGIKSLSSAILYDHDETMIKLEKEYAKSSEEQIESDKQLGKYVLENW